MKPNYYTIHKNKINYFKTFLIALPLWIAVTSTYYRFSHPEKTETQAFLHIPKSFVLNFK